MPRRIVHSFTISLDGFGAGQVNSWRGWWGENPPYHTPTFVLTHHARAPLEMEVGDAATILRHLDAGLSDEMHLAQSPRFLGAGEPMFAGLDLLSLGYRNVSCTSDDKAVYYRIARG